MRWIRQVAAMGVVLAGMPASAGYYIEHEAVLPHPRTLQTVRTTIRSWHEGRRFKRESPLRGEVVVIDLDRREVLGIHHENRTYWKISSDRYRQLSLMSLMVMGIQPTQDGGIAVSDPMFEATGATAEIAGRQAREFRVHGVFPPGMATTFWVSPEVPIPLTKLVEEMRMVMGDPKHPSFERMFAQWLALPGYPVQSVTTVQTPRGPVVTSETLLTFQEMPIDEESFVVPDGYAVTVDPITEAEQLAREAAARPVGIGSPLQVTPKRSAPGGVSSGNPTR